MVAQRDGDGQPQREDGGELRRLGQRGDAHRHSAVDKGATANMSVVSAASHLLVVLLLGPHILHDDG
jgi:hypothetical protein